MPPDWIRIRSARHPIETFPTWKSKSARVPFVKLRSLIPNEAPQCDFFGAHTCERLDKEEGEFFPTEWPEVIG